MRVRIADANRHIRNAFPKAKQSTFQQYLAISSIPPEYKRICQAGKALYHLRTHYLFTRQTLALYAPYYRYRSFAIGYLPVIPPAGKFIAVSMQMLFRYVVKRAVNTTFE
jgi:hypothetical protein